MSFTGSKGATAAGNRFSNSSITFLTASWLPAPPPLNIPPLILAFAILFKNSLASLSLSRLITLEPLLVFS